MSAEVIEPGASADAVDQNNPLIGDTLRYARADSGQDLAGDAGRPGVALRPWTTYTVGDNNLTPDLAARLLQDGVCVKL